MMRRSLPWLIFPLLMLLAGCQYLIDSTAPAVNITNPVDDTVVAGSVTVQATVADSDSGLKSARILLDGSLLTEKTYPRSDGARYETLSDTVSEAVASLAAGEYTITVEATNAFDVTGTATKELTVVPDTGGRPDQESPTAEWITPEDGDIVSGVVALSAFASDDIGVTRVEFYAGTTLIGEDNTAPYSVEWDTTGREDGPVSLQVVAIDGVGRRGTSSINVQILNAGVPPSLSLRQPTEGSSVGVQFTVTAEITERGTDFSWVPEDGHNLWARVYDQVGNLVAEGYMTDTGTDAGTEPPDGEDFIAQRNFDLESFLGELPLDRFTVIVTGTVNVNGEDVTLSRKAEFDVVLESNLPPALLLFAPVSAAAAGTEPTFGNTLGIVGRVTDDSGSIHAVEVRMVCDSCAAPGEPEPIAQNKLLYYVQGDYDLFSTGIIPLDGTPYVEDDGNWVLRVIAIDSADTTLRNIINIDVNVDRDPALFAELAGAWGDPVTEPPTSDIDPSAATWTFTFAAPLAGSVEAIAAVKKDGEVMEVVKGTLEAGDTEFTYRRSFGDADVGSWSIDLVLQDLDTGGQRTTISPSVGVSQIE